MGETSKELRRRDEIKMSFVGIMKSHFGLVAFGDSQSTRFDIAGNPYRDEMRQVKKVFKANSFLLVTYGTNTVIRDDKEVPLEDIMNFLLEKQETSLEEFLKRLNKEFLESYAYGREYHFIFGKKDDKEYTLNTADLSKEGITYGKYLLESCIFCKTSMAVDNMVINCHWSIEKMKSAAEIWCQSVIDMGDTFLEYNPVGKPIIIESLF